MLDMVRGGACEAPSLVEELLAIDSFYRKENPFSSVIYLQVSCPFPSNATLMCIHTQYATLIKPNRLFKK